HRAVGTPEDELPRLLIDLLHGRGRDDGLLVEPAGQGRARGRGGQHHRRGLGWRNRLLRGAPRERAGPHGETDGQELHPYRLVFRIPMVSDPSRSYTTVAPSSSTASRTRTTREPTSFLARSCAMTVMRDPASSSEIESGSRPAGTSTRSSIPVGVSTTIDARSA